VTVTAPCPLPITDIGSRSVYLPGEDIEDAGRPVRFGLAWLDHEANAPGWEARKEMTRQLSLF
jgi:hypothetical protein